jgi:uncharacterized membrane protein YagU involved in acid resistance
MDDGSEDKRDGTVPPVRLERSAAESVGGISDHMSATVVHVVLKLNWLALIIWIVFMFAPPVVTWKVAQVWPPINGFLGVVVGWFVAVMTAVLGYWALVKERHIQRL